MIFEKKELIKIDEVYILLVLSIVIVSVLITYGVCVILGVIFPGEINSKFSLFDVVNAVSQVATALTFCFALMQYRKSIIQQRQKIISDEAVSQINRMISVIDGIDSNEKTNIENLSDSMDKLWNINVNFEELFKAMNEDVQKAIVRMRWQDMLFNHFMNKMLNVDFIEILKNDFGYSIQYLNEKTDAFNVEFSGVQELKKFFFYSGLLHDMNHKDQILIKKKFENIGGFLDCFTKNEDLNDLLYGLMSVVDARFFAPFLAAIKNLIVDKRY